MGLEGFHRTYDKVQEYFVYRDGHGLGTIAIHLVHHCFSFDMGRFDTFMTTMTVCVCVGIYRSCVSGVPQSLRH